MCGSSFNNVSERSTENTIKLINGLVDNLENYSSLSDFKYVFRSSRLTADLLTVAYDRTAWTCKIFVVNDLSDDLSLVLLYLPMILLSIVCIISRLIYDIK